MQDAHGCASGDVQTVTEAGLLAASDAAVLAHAREEERIVLTRNARDFAQLHEALPDHPGILVVCQDGDAKRDMSYADIVRAIANLEGSDVQIPCCLHVLNADRW